jgi:hypothetical protein
MVHPSFYFHFYGLCRLVHISIRTMLCIFIFFWHTPSLSTPYGADIDYHKPARTSEVSLLCPCQHPVHIHLAAPLSFRPT